MGGPLPGPRGAGCEPPRRRESPLAWCTHPQSASASPRAAAARSAPARCRPRALRDVGRELRRRRSARRLAARRCHRRRARRAAYGPQRRSRQARRASWSGAAAGLRPPQRVGAGVARRMADASRARGYPRPLPPSLPYKVDTSRPSLPYMSRPSLPYKVDTSRPSILIGHVSAGTVGRGGAPRNSAAGRRTGEAGLVCRRLAHVVGTIAAEREHDALVVGHRRSAAARHAPALSHTAVSRQRSAQRAAHSTASTHLEVVFEGSSCASSPRAPGFSSDAGNLRRALSRSSTSSSYGPAATGLSAAERLDQLHPMGARSSQLAFGDCHRDRTRICALQQRQTRGGFLLRVRLPLLQKPIRRPKCRAREDYSALMDAGALNLAPGCQFRCSVSTRLTHQRRISGRNDSLNTSDFARQILGKIKEIEERLRRKWKMKATPAKKRRHGLVKTVVPPPPGQVFRQRHVVAHPHGEARSRCTGLKHRRLELRGVDWPERRVGG